jgi:hypothetical protein
VVIKQLGLPRRSSIKKFKEPPKVKNSDYIFIDRQSLNYLNLIEKINCCYCEYFTKNGQYWCPIENMLIRSG